METVAPKWSKVATAIGFDGARIDAIEMGTHYQPGDACRKMFTGWLEGGHDLKPATWDILIQCLKAAKLTEIANLLHSTIKIVSFVPIPLYDSYIMHIYFCNSGSRGFKYFVYNGSGLYVCSSGIIHSQYYQWKY